MPLPVSKKQIALLGDRLALPGKISPSDVELFESVMNCYDECQVNAKRDVVELLLSFLTPQAIEFSVTGRTKTTSTIRDKLQRQPEIKLPYIRDVAGLRIVAGITLAQQDEIGNLVRKYFGGGSDPKSWIDRRAKPVSGYRALHVVVERDGVPVEVQIRTELQALWADLYEAQADRWGRQIRYGGEPSPNADGQTGERAEFLADLRALSLEGITEVEDAVNRDNQEDSWFAERREQIKRLERQRTKQALASATEIRARVARAERLANEIKRLGAEWSESVRSTLVELADRADTVQ